MKPQNILIAALCAGGAIAAPSWAWKDDTSVEQYFRTDGQDVFFCKAGWEVVSHSDPNHGLALSMHNKREAEPAPILDLLKNLLKKLLDKLNNILKDLTKLKYELGQCKKNYDDWKKVRSLLPPNFVDVDLVRMFADVVFAIVEV